MPDCRSGPPPGSRRDGRSAVRGRRLVPAIVQDAADGRVLMLAWMNEEALNATVATGEVHFHSRSRNALWRKGETSGNVLRLVDIAEDCDRDALLVTVDPVGPTCHRGNAELLRSRGRPRRQHDAGVRLARNAVGHDRGTRGNAALTGSYTPSCSPVGSTRPPAR